jgi:Tfp pilus assembly protein PilF
VDVSLKGALIRQAYKKLKRNDYSAALKCATQVLDHFPDDVKILNFCGITMLRWNGQYDQAVYYFKRALEVNPEISETFNNLGRAYWAKRDDTSARGYFYKAISKDRHLFSAYYNLAVMEKNLERFPQAEKALMDCISIRPDELHTKYHLLDVYEACRLFPKALKFCDWFIRNHPTNPKLRFLRSRLRMRIGDYKHGWVDYEWRVNISRENSKGVNIQWSMANWQGQNFHGKTLLIQQDQGFGDVIQMLRFLPAVKERGGNVILWVKQELRQLLADSSLVDGNLILLSEKIGFTGMADYVADLSSLPFLLQSGDQINPIPIPYLSSNKRLSAKWLEQIGSEDFKVGICWSGEPLQANNERRSCSPLLFKEIDLPGVTLVSLQIQKNKVAVEEIGYHLVDLSDSINDFADTAAIMRNLDLIVTIDTSVAHLAGALGSPVWTILNYTHCWRYGIDQSYCPWYPKMKLFVQADAGNWKSVINNVRTDLQKLVGSQSSNDLQHFVETN